MAVIGIGCRFPGGADDPDCYWHILHNGMDAITEVPPDRWNIADYFDPDPDAEGKMYSRWGGFIRNVDQFDPHLFGNIAERSEQHGPPAASAAGSQLGGIGKRRPKCRTR